MNFTDVLFVMAESVGVVHPDERDTLVKSMIDALLTVEQISEVERYIIVNCIGEHDGNVIDAITELLNEDDEQ